MSKTLRVVLAQLNFCVGDIQGNLTKLIQSANTARDELKADLIVFPELCTIGYPPEDLLLRKNFLEEANEALNQFKNEVQNIYCVVSHPHQTSQGLFNSCSLIYNGKILGRYAKQNLPNYGVFDELRHFMPGNSSCVIPLHNGLLLGIVICEDLWAPTSIQLAATQGARLIVIPNASPFEVDKHEQRHSILAKRAKTENVSIAYVNCVGQQDEIAFDGGSMVVDPTGKISQFAGFCNEILLPVDIEFLATETNIVSLPISIPSEEERIYKCLTQGVQDYLKKNNFPGAIVGISGGIDSALTLAVAVDALGQENVKAVLLPSRYTSDISNEDAIELANNLGVQYEIIPIEPAFETFLKSLKPSFAGKEYDITEENLQSRCRGTILMALSNKTGRILLSTGNRSEMAVGYATLYGDMCGGLAVLKDIPKTLVYKLAEYRNKLSPVIPQRTLDRPPTAELAPNQKDEDTLPPYLILDKILELYLNQEMGVKEIIALGFDEDTVRKIVRMINRSEYKRRQAAIGIRINHKAFGKDRRYPITNKFND